jgi:hypothetical protein
MQVALKRFIDGIAIDIIETTLVQALGDIFSPTTVDGMTCELVTLIAGESKEAGDFREQLCKKLEILCSGLEICHKFSRASDFGRTATISCKESFTDGSFRSLQYRIDPIREDSVGQGMPYFVR